MNRATGAADSTSSVAACAAHIHIEIMEARASEAVGLMRRFAEETGVSSDRPQRRYLWTDAFAVANFIGLARATGDPACAERALQLVRRVHQVLARHRPEDQRSRWLGASAGPAHPTRGGLRIGKRLPERAPGEPLDPRLEWDRDGQYFHYLTRWMHALDLVTRATGEPMFNQWARELAEVAHRAFTVAGPPPRMVWKMSVDLSRVLVSSMGQHDPLEGYVCCRQLDATAVASGRPPILERQRDDFERMIDTDELVTTDPLGIGGLLLDAHRLADLGGDEDLVLALLAAALVGLRAHLGEVDLGAPANRRLAFRELGLAIGLAAAERIEHGGAGRRAALVSALAEHAPAGDAIEAFWRRREHRDTPSWREHGDINDVMLATRLVPDGLLDLRARTAGEASAVFC
jgi:hypothetical protein